MALIKGKAAKNVLQGMRNKAAGEHFENLILESLRYHAANGTAIITKTPEPMRPIKSLGNGKFVAHYVKKAQVDFCGTLHNGRAIRFEAKHTDTDRFTRDRLTDEQMKDLKNHEAMGAYCCVMICFGLDHVYRIPWIIWENMKLVFGRNYITEEDVKNFGVETESTGRKAILGYTKEEPCGVFGSTPAEEGTTWKAMTITD